jgi:hypothetical protein
MKVKVQVVMITDDGHETTREIACVERQDLTPETFGLSLAAGKAVLQALQEVVVEWQMHASLQQHRVCPHCGKVRQSKGVHHMGFRTVFGALPIDSPRLSHCPCQPHTTTRLSPFAVLLPERTTPDLLYLETTWAALLSYGLTVKLLQDVLPIDEPLHAVTIRNHGLEVAQRLEDTLGEEQWSFIDKCPAEVAALPLPHGPLTVGIDGGYVKAQGEQGTFEVMAGTSLLAFHRGEEAQEPIASTCFAFVQTYDQKPTRRLFEVLQSQGHQLNPQITCLSDGGDTVRDLQLYLNPQAEHLLDWFHVTMRLTVMQQPAKSPPETTRDEEMTYAVRAPVTKELERLTWFLWHGNVYQALQVIETIEGDLEVAVATSGDSLARKLLKAVEEFHTYIKNNAGFIPNYGERYRHGERISTGFVESTVNQVVSKRRVKKQQMQWSKRGAHLLLQIRTRVLNGEWEDTFRTWYPGFRAPARPQAACVVSPATAVCAPRCQCAPLLLGRAGPLPRCGHSGWGLRRRAPRACRPPHLSTLHRCHP